MENEYKEMTEKDVVMENENSGHHRKETDDSLDGSSHEKYYMLNSNIMLCSTDIKDMKVSFEQFRREIAVGFVPRDVLDLHVANMQEQMTTLEKKLDEIKDEIQRSQQRAVSNVERLWLRVGTVGGAIGVMIAVLEYLQRAH